MKTIKRSPLPALLLILLSVSFSTCHPGEQVSLVFKGKLVIKAACAHYVIQVLDAQFPKSKLMASWKDDTTDSTYTNVFKVANLCSFPSDRVSQGDTIIFALDNNPPPMNCMICTIAYPTPPVSNSVNQVQKIN